MAHELEVWLSADHVGTLSGIHGRLNFRYTAAWLVNPRSYAKLSGFTYKRGMGALDRYLDEQLSRDRAYFSALEPLAHRAKSMKLLDPSVKPLLASLTELSDKNAKWKLVINEFLETDF